MMRKCKFLSVILALMMFLGTFAGCGFAKDEISFMSFNINWAEHSLEADLKAKEKGWTQRKESVLKLINDSGAHVIGLQEVKDAALKDKEVNQRLYLEENLAEKYELIYCGREVALAMIYDKTVFNLISQEKYWFSDTPDELSNGWDGDRDHNYHAAYTLTLEHKATGETIKAINTHGPLDDPGNVKSFNLIAERSLSKDDGTITIMMGDFNARPGKLGYVPIAEKLQDCRVAAAKSPNREHRTWNGYTDTATGILDYCFASKGDKVEVLEYKVHTNQFGKGYYMSDHFAVQATIKIHSPMGDSAL